MPTNKANRKSGKEIGFLLTLVSILLWVSMFSLYKLPTTWNIDFKYAAEIGHCVFLFIVFAGIMTVLTAVDYVDNQVFSNRYFASGVLLVLVTSALLHVFVVACQWHYLSLLIHIFYVIVGISYVQLVYHNARIRLFNPLVLIIIALIFIYAGANLFIANGFFTEANVLGLGIPMTIIFGFPIYAIVKRSHKKACLVEKSDSSIMQKKE